MLYHYSTWRGEKIAESGLIKPRNTYAQYTKQAGRYPPVVFLTTDPVWEPSIQAATKEMYWEKCGSCPDVYSQLEIPCWRFIVIPSAYMKPAIPFCDAFGLMEMMEMMEDAVKLGSDITRWYVTESKVQVYQSAKWEGVWKVV